MMKHTNKIVYGAVLLIAAALVIAANAVVITFVINHVK